MKRVCIIAFLLFSLSCTNKKGAENKKIDPLLKMTSDDYDKVKSFFNDSMVSHFPSGLDSNYVTFTENLSPETGSIRLDLTCKLTPVVLKDFANATALSTYHAWDTCLLVVNRFATKENFYNIKVTDSELRKAHLECYDKSLPIPNFWDSKYATKETECHLPPDFIIKVLDAKPGKFLNDSLLTNGQYMPSKWKNGFSKGFAVSEKQSLIIYWTILW